MKQENALIKLELFVGLILKVGVIEALAAVRGVCLGAHVGTCALSARLSIQLFGNGIERLFQGLGIRLDRRSITGCDRSTELFNRLLDGGLILLAHLIAKLTQRLFALENEGLGVVLGVNRFLLLLVLLSELFGILTARSMSS